MNRDRSPAWDLIGYYYEREIKGCNMLCCSAQTSSIQAYKPTPGILDYACTKGAIVALTKGDSMSCMN